MPTGQGMTESATGGMQLGRRLRELKQTKASSNNAPGGGGGAPGGGTP